MHGDWVVAVPTYLLFAATLLLAAVAWYQIGTARTENRITQTLLACGQYDTSPVIFECIKTLGAALAKKDDKGESDVHKHPMNYRREIMTLLNFLDAIAIGVGQGLYEEKVAFDHIEGIVRTHVAELIDSGIVDRANCRRENWHRLIDLRDKWVRDAPIFNGK